ncbi:ABC transporter ATP-binding protein [Salegentibacter sp. JZCK2]|uniref:ABC transporter ATP-binding protein n=1 Tax=Salegentibacter tibetensis TaxID=2873600 RepID=UPI001CCE8EAC|nr:ABC transporter ATP-binding protein [Salegentibacter tibetensis]MBZ9729737.1 ABC transporter ATP-binding protein [Salegentibacter tibetensis]
MSVILKAENISKQYRLGTVGTGTLSHDLNRWWHMIRGKEDPYLQVGGVNDRSAVATEDYVWALRDINFEVKQGEVLGIIGKNGAGKSTLLKLLSRVTAPTTGTIKTKGRIASLLEIGTGFHPELTGRENIFMNGAVLGMKRAEIKAKLEEIIAFSGCEMYIDTPVKRYSSGMTVRLGFAVAAHLEPEILVVDEVLAVGDAEFQKKAIGKMQDLSMGEGRTVLFVSHNMGSVRSLCTRGIVLNNGELFFEGESSNAIDFYLNQDSTEVGSGRMNFTKENLGNKELKLLEASITDKIGRVRTTFSQSEGIRVHIKFEVFKSIIGMRFNLKVKTTSGEDVFVTSSHFVTKGGVEKGVHELQLEIPAFLLNMKRYVFSLNAGIPGHKIIIEPIDTLFVDIVGENAGGSDFVEKWPGIVSPKIKWILNEKN